LEGTEAEEGAGRELAVARYSGAGCPDAPGIAGAKQAASATAESENARHSRLALADNKK
jgi:hypothetical protein